MLTKFEKHIKNTFPFLIGAKVLVAVSGGIDSIVLTHLCHEMKLDIALAHCNFNLRGNDSSEDEQFVHNLGKQLKKEVHVQHFKTEKYAKKQKLSIQMAARELRYQWFTTLCNTSGYEYILTAHHADDNLETFIINLSRGTGLDGLTGIPPVNGKVIRPLLSFSRKEILTFAEENKIEWREDKSNLETKYLRNKIRLEVSPVLKELHPTFLQNFMNTQEYLSGSAQIMEAQTKEFKSVLFNKDGGIYKVLVAQLLRLNPLKAYLYEFFKEFGFTQSNDIVELLKAQSGKQLFSSTHRMIKDRDYILIDKIGANNHEIKAYPIHIGEDAITHPVKMNFNSVSEIQNENPNVIYVDKETLKFPLILRKWQNGDYFYPFGLAGKKKLSKFFKDEKYSLIEKEKQWLLCSDNRIVWVLGKRADDRFKVTEKTAHILKIQTH